jgi:putative sugar O-methyltransferase
VRPEPVASLPRLVSEFAGISAKRLVGSRVRERLWQASSRLGLSQARVAIALHRSRMPEALESRLKEMRRDNGAARFPFRATEHWRRLNARFDDWFHWYGLYEIETHPINAFLSGPPVSDPKLLRYACWLLYRDLQRRDELGLLDRISASIDESTGKAFRFQGRLVSWDLLISLDTLYTLYEVDSRVLTGRVVVADLGAGWGRLGYALKQANPEARYVVFDLPEMLLVSSTYLPRLLPSEKVADYGANRHVEVLTRAELSEGPGLRFCGAHHLERVEDGGLDVLISVASFQEMVPEQVDEYFELIDQKVRTFYTQQLRSARTHKLHLGEIEGLCAYPFRPGWKQVLLRSPSWSDLYFETVQVIRAE